MFIKSFIAAATLLLIWCASGFIVFIFLPWLSELPYWAGAAAGVLCFLLQFFLGHRLIERITGKPADDTYIFLLEKAGRKDLSAQISAPRFCLAAYAGVPAWLRRFEAFTLDYGRLRLAQGPLWYLGKACGFIAFCLEAPLMFASKPGAGDAIIKAEQAIISSDYKCRSLWPLTPFSEFRAKRCEAGIQLGLNYEQLDGASFDKRRYWPCYATSFGFIAAIFGLWWAPLLFLGTGLLVRELLLHGWKKVSSIDEAVQQALSGEIACVCVSGSITGSCLQASSSGVSIMLANFASNEQCSAEVIGCIMPDTLRLEEYKVAKDGKILYSRQFFGRLCLFSFIIIMGAAWCVLQNMGF